MENVVSSYLKDRKETVSYDGKDENGLSPLSYEKIEQHLKEFTEWCKTTERDDLRLIKTFELREFHNHLKAKNNSAKTRKNKLANLKKFFDTILRLYGIEFVPDMPLFEKIKTKEPHVEIMDEADRLSAISKIPAAHQPIFQFMAATGCRPCEFTALKHKHIINDDDLTYWHVQAELTEGYYRQITKTKNEWDVPLEQFELDIIKSVPRSLQTEFVFYWVDTRDKNKHKPYREKMLRTLWQQACAAAGIDYIPPYPSFRHSTITGWLDSGMSEEDASALVGHKCRSTIKKYDKSKRIERLRKAKKGLLFATPKS